MKKREIFNSIEIAKNTQSLKSCYCRVFLDNRNVTRNVKKEKNDQLENWPRTRQ